MLVELAIRDFVVLKSVRVRMGPGLTAVTGETGSGKSLILDALKVLLGGRASAEHIRTGRERSIVEGLVEPEDSGEIGRALDEQGLKSPEEEAVILRREIRRGGRSRAWINGSPVPAAALRRVGALLVEIHGQHEQQRVLRSGHQLRLLDAFSGALELRREVAQSFREYEAVAGKLEELRQRTRDAAARADLLSSRLEEIEGARIAGPGEEEELRGESSRLEHAETLRGGGRELERRLRSAQGSVTDQLSGMCAQLERLARMDPALKTVLDALDSARHEVSEAAADLAALSQRYEHDPGRLEQVRRRLALLGRLAMRYGPRLEDVLETGKSLRKQLDEFESSEWEIARLKRKARAAEETWRRRAERLGKRRVKGAAALEKEVDGRLGGLGLEGGRFQVRFRRESEISPSGREGVDFEVALNPGFPPASLRSTASGGELSRVILALKAVLVGVADTPTMAFDEVDAGIGGRVARAVALRLQEVARKRQLLVITHLARVAAGATAHVLIEKSASEDGFMEAKARTLNPEERALEVARMLGGDPSSRESIAHARRLLEEGGAAS